MPSASQPSTDPVERRALSALALGAFVVGTAELLVVGVLASVAGERPGPRPACAFPP